MASYAQFLVSNHTIENLELNTFLDGVFHSDTYVFLLAGLFILGPSGRLRHFHWSTADFVATMLIGFGTFNLIEGIIDHQFFGPAPRQRNSFS